VLALDYSKRDRDELRRTENTRLLLLKNRHGPVLTVPVVLDYGTLGVRELMPHEASRD
jgi:hypothetical protein